MALRGVAYDLMQAQKPELLAQNVNTWFADKPSSYMVRSMDYGAGQVARALLSERYRRIVNMEIATAVLPLLAGNDQYGVMSCEVTENRLYLKVVNHRLEMEVSKGDIVQVGVMISNSEVGLGAVSIQPLAYRLVCTNGMVVNDMGERRHHVDRQAKAVEDSFALYSDETMEAEDNARLWRQGQTQVVTIRHIITKDTVDEDVMAALEQKDMTQEKLTSAVKARLGEYSRFYDAFGRNYRSIFWTRRVRSKCGCFNCDGTIILCYWNCVCWNPGAFSTILLCLRKYKNSDAKRCDWNGR